MRSLIILLVLSIGCGFALAASSDAPQRKSGLWEIKMSGGHMPGGMTMQQCVDQKSDDISKMQEAKSNCTKNVVRREGDKIVAESICKMQGTTATTRTVFTGKFDSAYKAEIRSTYDPPLHGMRESSSMMDAKWLGPCLAGQKAGDMVMPGMPGGMPNMGELMKRGQKGQ
ncbi:MAG TPA: DUF3617 family protein [Candidatus Binatia bacterium]|nr:DUF3617 family protein [Candidatus Binatia bacterium]